MNDGPRWFGRAQGVLLLALILPACGQVLGLEETELGWDTGDAAVDHYSESGGNSSAAGSGGNSQNDAATGGYTGGSGGATGGSGGATGGSGGYGSKCGILFGDQTCDSCMDRECLNECKSLADAKNIFEYIQCFQNCGASDKTCKADCAASYPEASKANTDLSKCLGVNCTTECGSIVGCGLGSGDATVDKCINDKCHQECVNATYADGFSDYFACTQACTTGDTACQDKCSKTYPEMAAALDVLNACTEKNCTSTNPNKCALQSADDTCNACINGKCLASCEKCAKNSECLKLMECIQKCVPGDSACQQKCQTDHADGINDLMDFLGENGCLTKNCATECK